MNKLMDNNIVLDKDVHEYSLLTQSDIQFISVTTLVDHHFEGFDAEKIATDLVNNHPKYVGRTAESLIADWDAARQHGTDVHDEIENWVKEGVIPREPKAVVAVDWLKNYQKKLKKV